MLKGWQVQLNEPGKQGLQKSLQIVGAFWQAVQPPP